MSTRTKTTSEPRVLSTKLWLRKKLFISDRITSVFSHGQSSFCSTHQMVSHSRNSSHHYRLNLIKTPAQRGHLTIHPFFLYLWTTSPAFHTNALALLLKAHMALWSHSLGDRWHTGRSSQAINTHISHAGWSSRHGRRGQLLLWHLLRLRGQLFCFYHIVFNRLRSDNLIDFCPLFWNFQCLYAI